MNEAEDLASAIYPIIRPLADKKDGKISYSGLCSQFVGRWAGLDPRSQLLSAALGVIVDRCRAVGLPALSAVVVHAEGDRRPGKGYFIAAHPDIDDQLEREVAWAEEFKVVHESTYPASYDDL